MKGYVELIKKVILDKTNESGFEKSLLFRVEDVPDPQVYWQIASFFNEWSSLHGSRFTAKLSHGKYQQFRKTEDPRVLATLEKLSAEGYVDKNDHMTFWRNQAAEGSGLTILMGTEAVEDKGGLGDFYAITSHSLDRELRNQDGQYASWFERVVGHLTDLEQAAINNFVENVFRISTRNLFRLSIVVDELEQEEIHDSDDLVHRLFERLYVDWGLPRVCTNVPSVRNLANATRARSFFDDLSRFQNRKAFRELTRQRLEELISSIKEKDVEANLTVQAPAYSSVSELKEELVLYITGEELPRVRPRILSSDYSLIRSILEIRRSRGKTTRRDSTPKVYGPPIKAVLAMLLHTLAENPTATSVRFSVNSIRLAGCTSNDEAYQQWHKLRLLSGGLLEFLNVELTETCKLQLKWCNDQDPFALDGVDLEQDVRRATATKKLSTIDFTVTTDDEAETHFVWEFDPKASWLYTFFHVLSGLDDAYNKAGIEYIPFGHVKRFSELITSNNEEEFFARLETARANFDTNVVTLLEQTLSREENDQILRKIRHLGKRFTAFLDELTKHGFYASTTINEANSLIKAYCELIDWLGNAPLTEAARSALVALANAFLLVDASHNPLKKGLDGAVVLPLHPAMLEKLVAQAQFIRDGAREIVQGLRTHDDQTKDLVKKAKRRLKTFEQLSTISFAVDALWASQGNQYIAPTHTFGFFTIYREAHIKPVDTALSGVLADDVAADEQIPAAEVLRESPVSQVIYDKLSTYVKTFPSQVDGLHILFINPPDLQPVVAGIHQLIDTLKKESNGSKVRVRLTVLAPPQSLGSRSFLRYWLDNFFEDVEDVDISTFFKTISFSGPNLGENIRRALRTSPVADVTFIQNVLTVTEIRFEKSPEKPKSTYLTRFPMVFHPLPVFRTSHLRRTSISQRQFASSSAHAQLIRYLSDSMNKYVECVVVNQLQLQPNYSNLLEVVHDHSRWVVCIDPGIDRKIIETEKQRIISFATGVGPFGELNVTVSSRADSVDDLKKKLVDRLRWLFSRWSPDTLEAAAQQCLDIAARLDGAQLLQALNPNDYELHNFLAYILTAQYLKIGTYEDQDILMQTLVPLDSHEHWFRSNADLTDDNASNLRPDYLLLEVKRHGIDSELVIHATVIECKMGRESRDLVNNGKRQLAQGIKLLRTIWNPERESIDRRYWYSQLYRALVFSPINLADNDPMNSKFNEQLREILDGNFSISWQGLLLTFWLDSPSDQVKTSDLLLEGCENVLAQHHAFGQVAVQKMLVDNDSEIQYVPVSDEEVLPDSTSTADSGAVEMQPTPPTNIEEDKSHRVPGSSETSTTPALTVAAEVQGSGVESEGTAPSSETRTAATDRSRAIRLLIGEDIRTGEPVYWEFGHPGLQNRHLLITGSSGSGKTYFMQALLLELSRHGVSSLIFDYTDGFTSQKLEPEFVERVGDKLIQLPIYYEPFPLNPFKRYRIEVAGKLVLQKPVDVAERIKSSFMKVFELGDQQANAVYNAVKQGLEKHGDNMTLAHLGEELRILSEHLPPARTALARLEPLIDRDPFDHTSSHDWGMLEHSPGSIVVVQLSGFTRDVQVAITQLILWDAWYFQVQHGDKRKPFPVVLDEAQNLDHSETSPTAMILTEGRKFGWSGWFATQFLKGQMDKDELGRLQQASQKVFFRPPEAELRDVALMIDPDRTVAAEWQLKLNKLQKGQCVVSGWFERNGNLYKDKPRIVKVTPLSARGGSRQ